MGAKFPSVPRPPETIMFASESSGRAPRTAGSRAVIRAEIFVLTAIFSIFSIFSALAELSAGTGSIEFGRTVITGIPLDT